MIDWLIRVIFSRVSFIGVRGLNIYSVEEVPRVSEKPEGGSQRKLRESEADHAKTPPSERQNSGKGPRTRGGWIPVGTAADRRTAHSKRGTERGREARQHLLEAARRVFEREGYLNASVDDIVQEAGIARGSFYTYFPSKVGVFREVVREVGEAIDEALAPLPRGERLDSVEALANSNIRYMAAFKNHARIYSLAEQMAHIDEETSQQHVARRHRDVERISNTIRRWQLRGVADPNVEPISTAAALLSMTRHLCYWLYVGGDEDYDEAAASTALNDIWVKAVDLRRQPNPKWVAEPADSGN